MEKWKDIPGYEGIYQVSNQGRVRSIKRLGNWDAHIKAQFRDRQGYAYVNLSKERQSKRWRVHRLVAMAFIPNPNEKPYINHINGIKNCNEVSNLEWVTPKENIRHAFKSGFFSEKTASDSIPVIATNIYTGEIIEFESMTQADRVLGLCAGYASRLASNGKVTKKGFSFRRKEPKL